ncbi:MAG: hypothetical protein WEB06_04650 [Actinomycetota bacterium]
MPWLFWMFYISRDALKRRAIDDLWKEKAATSPKSLATTLLADPVVTAIRKELSSSDSFPMPAVPGHEARI